VSLSISIVDNLTRPKKRKALMEGLDGGNHSGATTSSRPRVKEFSAPLCANRVPDLWKNEMQFGPPRALYSRCFRNSNYSAPVNAHLCCYLRIGEILMFVDMP
jgi:hypothetical protein